MSTETIGVNSLGLLLSRSKFLEPYILSNDKTPSWDGEIYVYKVPGKKKKDLFGKVPVQVKTRKVKRFSGTTLSTKVTVVDLKNYYSDGGIVYFIVEATHNDEKIYFNSLLPSDIKEILANLEKKEQPDINILFMELDTSSMDKIENVCRNFLLDRVAQYSTKDCPPLKIEEAIEKSITVFAGGIPIDDYLLSNQVRLYGREFPGEAKRFICKIRTDSIARVVKKTVSINLKVYYKEYKIIKNKEEVILKFGNEIFLDTHSNRISYKFSGSLKEQIDDINFLKDLVEKRVLCLGDKEIRIKRIDDESKFKSDVEQALSFLNDTYSLLSKFGVDSDRMDLDKLDKISFSRLNELIKIFIYGYKLKTSIFPVGFNAVQVCNIVLGFYIFQRYEDEIYQFENIFKEPYNFQFRQKINDGREIQVCPFVFLKFDFLTIIDNLDLQHITKDIKRIELTETYAEEVNFFELELIKAYDSTLKEEFTDTALKIIKWLIENYPKNPIFILNKLQIIHRSRSFNSSERDELLELKEKYKDDMRILCGVNILLENKVDAEICFSGLADDEKKLFETYPIYSLAKQLGINLT